MRLAWHGLVAVLLALACIVPASAQVAAAPATSGLPDDVELFVGDARVLQADIERVAVGSGRVVSASSPRQGELLLLGEGAGSTSLQLWLRDGTQRRIDVVVRAVDLSQRLAEVRGLLGPGRVTARIAGERIVLEGDRVSDAERGRARAIVEGFPGLVVDFIDRVGWETMIQLDVRIVEVRRDQVSALGLRWDDAAAGPVVAAEASTVDGRSTLSAAFASTLGSRLDLLQQRGLAETLARPMLSCRSGGVARFVAGGEVPLPASDGFGALNVQYKEYGVIVEVRPLADAGGAIQADVEVELSQVDPSVRVQNFPGFVKRRSVTAVNLRTGETVAIAGLLAREAGRSRQALPGLGQLPAAGLLFGSRRRQERRTELLVLITPRTIESGLEGPADATGEHRARVRDGLAREAAVDPSAEAIDAAP